MLCRIKVCRLVSVLGLVGWCVVVVIVMFVLVVIRLIVSKVWC